MPQVEKFASQIVVASPIRSCHWVTRLWDRSPAGDCGRADGNVLICCSVEPACRAGAWRRRVIRMNRRTAPTLQPKLGHHRGDNGVEMDGGAAADGCWMYLNHQLYWIGARHRDGRREYYTYEEPFRPVYRLHL
jgi:hypothetical protein